MYALIVHEASLCIKTELGLTNCCPTWHIDRTKSVTVMSNPVYNSLLPTSPTQPPSAHQTSNRHTMSVMRQCSVKDMIMLLLCMLRNVTYGHTWVYICTKPLQPKCQCSCNCNFGCSVHIGVTTLVECWY